jgi:hypothetical protein
MTEAPLEKVLRLAASPAKSKPSSKKPRFGTPYRVAWANVHVGDALMFSNQVWKVVPPTAHPGHKSATLPDSSDSATALSSPSAASATGAKPSAVTGMSPVSKGKSPTGQSPAGATSLQVFKHCLQNMDSPGKYEELTLPDNFVVMAVPLLP